MQTYLSLEYTHAKELPPGHDVEVRTPNALVEHFLEAYSDPGDTVLDIFAGYGTTLTVAEEMNREPYGIEYESDRVEYTRDQLTTPDHVRQGDIRQSDLSWLPACDCCFTSPPFMEQTDDRNPFRNYSGESSYEMYLDDIEGVFARLEPVMRPGGNLIVDIANMKYDGRVTTLAWDVADRIADAFRFDGEVVVTWEDGGKSPERTGAFGYGYDHSYCLVFSKGEET